MNKVLKQDLSTINFEDLQGVNLIYDGEKPVAVVMNAQYYAKLQSLITKVRTLLDKKQAEVQELTKQ